ncbi:MAG: hypothetical protein KF862_22530 [Chitinophagaceae bacterium]|nr:hypothetical protein [Chitinophagaceae bacterium]
MSEEKQRNWWRAFSPCILTAIFAAFIVLFSFITVNSSQGWSLLGVIIYLPVLFALLIGTFISRLIARENTQLLWLIEILFIAIVFSIAFRHLI